MSYVLVRKSTLAYASMHGKMKKIPERRNIEHLFESNKIVGNVKELQGSVGKFTKLFIIFPSLVKQ